MNLLKFTFSGNPIRMAMQGAEPWWIAKDVCTALDLTGDPGQHLRRLDEDEKGLISIQTPGGPQDMVAINEPGLYSLVLASRKPEAKMFKRWVRHEVLPSIRKTGSYSVAATEPQIQAQTTGDALVLMAQAFRENERRMALLEVAQEQQTQQLSTLGHRLTNLDLANIDGTPRQRLVKMVQRYAYQEGIAYPAAWRAFDTAFNTAYRTNLTARRQNHAAAKGKKRTDRPEYLEAAGQIEDVIRVADKMLNGGARLQANG